MVITAKELALKCGVSRGTVDRALKGREGINPETRIRVLNAAEEYGYRPNLLGQALSAGRTMTIGMVLFDFEHSFFAEFYTAFEKVADKFNYVLFPMLSHRDPKREEECILKLADRNVDGLIILPVNKGKVYETFLAKQHKPIVCVGNRLSQKIPFTGIDDQQAVVDAVAHLKAKGHKRIFYYCPPMRHAGKGNLYAQEKRLKGYKKALSRENLSGEAVVEEDALIDCLNVPTTEGGTAVLCSSDSNALELQRELNRRHQRLGKQVEIMGFDGLATLRYANPAIDSVHFSRETWAEKAFEQLYCLVQGKAAKDTIIPHTIISAQYQHGLNI